jgi:hypothetical protein
MMNEERETAKRGHREVTKVVMEACCELGRDKGRYDSFVRVESFRNSWLLFLDLSVCRIII